MIDLSGSIVPTVDLHAGLPVYVKLSSRGNEEVPDRIRLARCDHEVVSPVMLEHHPHRFDVIPGEPPVPASVQVPEIQFVLWSCSDCRQTPSDLARNEGFAASWG